MNETDFDQVVREVEALVRELLEESPREQLRAVRCLEDVMPGIDHPTVLRIAETLRAALYQRLLEAADEAV